MTIGWKRATVIAVVVTVVAVTAWWFWPRPPLGAEDIVITWQGEPQFTKQRTSPAP